MWFTWPPSQLHPPPRRPRLTLRCLGTFWAPGNVRRGGDFAKIYPYTRVKIEFPLCNRLFWGCLSMYLRVDLGRSAARWEHFRGGSRSASSGLHWHAAARSGCYMAPLAARLGGPGCAAVGRPPAALHWWLTPPLGKNDNLAHACVPYTHCITELTHSGVRTDAARPTQHSIRHNTIGPSIVGCSTLT